MGYPEINNNIDKPALSTDTISYPFNSPSMADKSFNETFGYTQSTDQVSFLASDEELLSQISEQTYTTFANPANDKFSNQTNGGQNTDQAPKKNTDQAPTTDQAPKQTTDQVPKQTTDQAQKQTPDVTQLSERPAQRFPQSENNNIIIGALEYGFDEYGELFSIKGPKDAYYYVGADGKWVEHMPPNRERTVDNFKFDDEGNVTFDVIGNGYKAHHERKADGSYSVDSAEYGGKMVYDKDGNLTEAPAGDGHPPRKFHYDKDGKLDRIEGRLGQWERKVEDGKVVWVNNKGARWEGEMSINPKTNDLEFRGRNGVAWNFTTRGQDVAVRSR